MSEEECLDILGVSREASRDEIVVARRRLAREMHPDAGGSHGEMARLNEAARILLSVRPRPSLHDASAVPGASSAQPRHVDAPGSRVTRSVSDIPSFVIQTLPAVSFEILVVAAAHLGEVVEEDPPYLLEVLMRDPGPVWCRFELLPDAGSTTVLLSCDVDVGYTVYSIEEIRDLWISTINEGSVSFDERP